MNDREVMRKPFDIEIHKKTFINYLEIILLENGTGVYAVPSHTEKLISLACEKMNITREEVYEQCPKEYYFDVMTWLCQVTNCVALWNERMDGIPNEKQLALIKELIKEGIYNGPINQKS